MTKLPHSRQKQAYPPYTEHPGNITGSVLPDVDYPLTITEVEQTARALVSIAHISDVDAIRRFWGSDSYQTDIFPSGSKGDLVDSLSEGFSSVADSYRRDRILKQFHPSRPRFENKILQALESASENENHRSRVENLINPPSDSSLSKVGSTISNSTIKPGIIDPVGELEDSQAEVQYKDGTKILPVLSFEQRDDELIGELSSHGFSGAFSCPVFHSESGNMYPMIPWHGTVCCTCGSKMYRREEFPLCKHELAAILSAVNTHFESDPLGTESAFEPLPPRSYRLVHPDTVSKTKSALS